MKPLAECRLYAFVDTAYLHGRSPAEITRQLCVGGADIIQFRAKHQPHKLILESAQEIIAITSHAQIPLVINDHPEIAVAVGAQYCHLGHEDFFDAGYQHTSEIECQSPTLKIGLSTHAPEQASRSQSAGADYIAIGPVFATPTKPGRPPVTLEYVRWAAVHVTLPWFAIGGITLANLDDVLAAGAKRICVVSAILDSPDIAATCNQFKKRLASAPQ